MENGEIMNSDASNLYAILKESIEAHKREEETTEKMELLRSKMTNANKNYRLSAKFFAEVESIIDLRKNLEFYFYQLLPFLIKGSVLNSPNQLDINHLTVAFKHTFYCYPYGNKVFHSEDNFNYYLPNQSINNGFISYLKKFIHYYGLGEIKIDHSNSLSHFEYSVKINATFKDLAYACYIGQEWVKALEDDCVDLLSDYYSQEQLESFKRTLHK